jgi:two-component system response regulator TctD
VGETLAEAGWRLDGVGTVADATAALATTAYDAILLDLGLPDGDGLDLIRSLRANNDKTPVLVLTARGAVDERVAGLDAGADDYLAKPFNNRELTARLRALLRRAPLASMPIIAVGALRFDPAAQEARCGSQVLTLTPRERAALEILMREASRVVARAVLENRLSRFGEEISPNAIELLISRLRRRLGTVETGAALETIRGVGYLLREVPG